MPQQTFVYTEPMQDGRRKIHPEDHKQIKRDYQRLESLQKTADLWGVSKRLILCIVNPASYERMKTRQRKNEHWRRYYTKEKRRLYQQKFRAKKRKAGLLSGLK